MGLFCSIDTAISKIRKDSRLKFYYRLQDNATITEENRPDEYNNNYRQLLHALYSLNEIDRSIMLLYLEDLSYGEIAGIGISHAGVKIHRLKSRLQKQLNS